MSGNDDYKETDEARKWLRALQRRPLLSDEELDDVREIILKHRYQKQRQIMFQRNQKFIYFILSALGAGFMWIANFVTSHMTWGGPK